MILKIALLSTLISTIHGASRYFISTYDQPLETMNQAYPIDVCVLYKITVVNFAPVNSYGVWTCNQDNTVTFTSHGTDSTCQTPGATESFSTSAAAGEVNAFNCDGTDDYVITDGCKVSIDATGECCTASECLPNIQALNVCVKNVDDSFSMVTCDATKTETYSYSAAGCSENSKSATPTDSSTVGECKYYATQVIYDIYLRMNACYQNGRGISEDSLCGYTYAPTGVTTAPTTANPTGVTTAPTTANPTVTAAPTTGNPTTATRTSDIDSRDNAFGYSIGYSVILSMVFAFMF